MLFAATSANLAGEPPAVSIEDALDSLKESPDIAVDAGIIDGAASTVIDMTGQEYKILREGVLKEKDISRLCLQD